MVVSATLHAPARSLAAACGLPLGAYRRDHVQACVVRVMRREQIVDLATLIARIDEDARLRSRLRRSIAVCTTGLFRDPTQLRWLDATVMPGLTAGAKRIRAWSAGCAAGEADAARAAEGDEAESSSEGAAPAADINESEAPSGGDE